MGFASQIATATNDRMNSSIFKQNVKFKAMAGRGALVFKLLPAFDPSKTIKEGTEVYMDSMGYLPFRLENGELTDWASLAYIARFVGHGTYKAGTRRDVVVWETFDKALVDSCPYVSLYRRAQQDPDFKQMTVDIKSPDGKTIVERAALTRPAMNMIANVIDINESEKGVVLGLFSTSAARSIVSSGGGALGLADQHASNSTDEQIKQNYLMQYALGDITDPQVGPVLVLTKATDRGEMSGYIVTLALDVAQRVRRWPLKPMELLEQRYNLPDLESYLVREDAETMIGNFVKIFNTRLANGYHEYALLNEVFGSIYGNLIPKAPSAPAATNVVQGSGMPVEASNEVAKPTRHRVMVTPSDIQAQAVAQEQAPAPVKEDQIPGAEMPPMTPGAPVKAFDRAAFLNRIKPK